MVSTSKNFDLGKLDRAIIFIIWFSGLAGVQKTKTVTLVLVTKKIFVNLFKPSHQSWTSTTSTFDYVYKEHRKNIYLSIQSSIHRIGITYTKSSRSARGCRNLKKERAPVYYFYLPTYIMIYNMRCDAIYKNETPNPCVKTQQMRCDAMSWQSVHKNNFPTFQLKCQSCFGCRIPPGTKTYNTTVRVFPLRRLDCLFN
ncbi:hypothetical protein ABKN59_010966 [Abortiporus biennis]